MKSLYSLPKDDLDAVLSQTQPIWDDLKGKQVFLTGGTGFFGVWLLESFAYANERLGLNASLTVLTRSESDLKKRLPHLFELPGVHFVSGDVRDFEFPKKRFSHVIHAATAVGVESLQIQSLVQFSTILDGTRRVLDFAQQSGVEKFLFVSSGAIYGDQPRDLTHVPETYLGAADPLLTKSTYGETKRLAEHLAWITAQAAGFEMKVVRPFAFVGPYLPLNANFAIGNFIRNVLENQPIQIGGDGTPVRSYLYAADLCVWLWTILISGKSGEAYNIGSEESINIRDLAELIAQGSWVKSPLSVHVAQTPVPGKPPARYVPNVQKAQTELKLKQSYSLIEAISQTIEWYRARKSS